MTGAVQPSTSSSNGALLVDATAKAVPGPAQGAGHDKSDWNPGEQSPQRFRLRPADLIERRIDPAPPLPGRVKPSPAMTNQIDRRLPRWFGNACSGSAHN